MPKHDAQHILRNNLGTKLSNEISPVNVILQQKNFYQKIILKIWPEN